MAEMERFDFPHHLVQDEFPNGATVRFGRGYTFASKPNGPDEVVFHLTFQNGMFFVQDIDPATGKFILNVKDNAAKNIMLLRAFYTRMLMYNKFIYPHPYLGDVTCRFNKPLLMPKVNSSTPGAVGGWNGRRMHQTEAFDVELILIP